jgi:hypothetical protein
MSKKKAAIRYAGPFFVENLTANSRDEDIPFPATLVVGVWPHPSDTDKHPQLTCQMMNEGEIDYEINQLIKQLERLRSDAKKLLIQHEKDDQAYFSKNCVSSAK